MTAGEVRLRSGAALNCWGPPQICPVLLHTLYGPPWNGPENNPTQGTAGPTVPMFGMGALISNKVKYRGHC